jgi:hypothetical protein
MKLIDLKIGDYFKVCDPGLSEFERISIFRVAGYIEATNIEQPSMVNVSCGNLNHYMESYREVLLYPTPPLPKKSKKICVDIKQIKKAAKYISKHNPHNFSYEAALESILSLIRRGIEEESIYTGTMGYMLKFSYEDGCIDVEVSVDPSLDCNSKYKTFNSIEELDDKINSSIINLAV